MCSKGLPAIVTCRSFMQVKSEAQSSPGVWIWSKKTSLGGPSMAFHVLIFRCKVRSWASGNRPETALKILKQGLGLEPGIQLQPVAKFGPDLLERILPGPPGSRGDRFTGQPLGVPILPSRLGVHTHLQSRKIERMVFAEELAKTANLGVFDHGGSLLTQEETA